MVKSFFLSCLIFCNQISAQSNSANEVLPSLQASADITLPDGRNITIHREAQTNQTRSSAIYFHRPLLALKESPSNEIHPIIWDHVQEDGFDYIVMKIILSTPEFRELARTAVIEEDPTIKVEQPEFKDADIDVRSWPVKVMRITATNKLTGKVFGESTPESLRTAGDVIDVSMKIESSEFPSFVSALNNERVSFKPSYTFTNAIMAFAQSANTISSQLTVEIDDGLKSLNIKEGEPVFQNQRDQFKTTVHQQLVTTIRATDSSLLAHVQPDDLSDLIFKQDIVNFEDVRKNPGLLEKVNEYLNPIIRKMSSENSSTDEDNDTTTNTKSWKVNAKNGQVGGELSNTNVRELENKHKTEFKAVEGRDVIEPHSIAINYLQSNWQRNVLSSMKSIYLAVGTDENFQDDSSFLVSFTEPKLKQIVKYNGIFVSPDNGMPKGVPMISFRKDVPKGWVALDGLSNWPKENWVPEHLRGKPVPDMRGTYARGILNHEVIGQSYGGGVFTVPELNITGEMFTMKSEKDVGVFNTSRQIISGAGIFTSHFLKTQILYDTIDDKKHIINSTQNRQEVYASQNKAIVVPAKSFTGDIEGEKVIPQQIYDLKMPVNQPKHVVGNWIMRVK